MHIGQMGPGYALGRYELLVPIANGGMAHVWAARLRGPRGFQRIVAIKLLSTELSEDREYEAMFLDEARLASRLRHPNVAAILELGEQAGLLYHVVEYVDGEPLSVVGRELQRLPLHFVINIGMQACAGLHAAHELRDASGQRVNLVHRDVSPQ